MQVDPNHLKTKTDLNYISRFSPYRAVNTFLVGYRKPVS